MSKRVNGGSLVGEEFDERAAKRRKIPASYDGSETPEKTTQLGLELIEIVKKTGDKSGRLIALPFLTLPNKRQVPDYYEVTKMPIALDTIEAKLKAREFPSLTALESYFKRMITNAKEYNQKGSPIYEDAERLRKAISNYMTKHNPAYKTPGYVAFPTPLLEEEDNEAGEEDAQGEEESEAEEDHKLRGKRGRLARNFQAPVQRSSATPAASDSKYAGVGFDGLTFQQAQEKIVNDLMQKKEFETDDFPEFLPFIVLPSRKEYKDYYEIIRHPVALKDLQKSVRGVRGKAAATGISEWRSWATFEDEVSNIWKNAFQYNEDNSDFYKLAQEFQKYFYKILGQAKAAVAEPPGTKLKLRMPEPTRITLKITGKASPADSPAPQAASQANGANGAVANGVPRRNPFSNQQTSSAPIPTDLLDRANSMSGSAASPTPSNSAPVKNEDARNSPAISNPYNNGHRAPSQAVSTPGHSGSSMLPPTTPALPNSSTYSQGGYIQSFHPQSQSSAPNLAFDSKWRQPGKDASDALITNLSLATHPGLNISRHFRLDIPPSATLAQQSITVNLPSTHYYLQIKPTIAASLYEEKRQHKLFVTSGVQRLQAMPLIPGHPVDQRHPLFEARLLPGVNKIDVELIAALPRGAPKGANGQDVELEKITIFATLLRA